MSPAGTRYHLAVIDGPDCGWIAPLPDHTAVIVGRDAEADLTLNDPELSRQHLSVRARGTRVRALCTSPSRYRHGCKRRNNTVRYGRWRRAPSRHLTLATGSQIELGSSVLELRQHPGLESQLDPVSSQDSLAMRLLIPLAMVLTMVPLALTSASPSLRTFTWLVLPLALVVATVWPWLRERARMRARPQPGQQKEPIPAPDPALLLATAAHPWRTKNPNWDLGRKRQQRQQPRQHHPMEPIESGHGIAIVGPPAAAAAMARWLLCQLIHAHSPSALAVRVPPTWDWASALPHAQSPTAPADTTVIVIDRTTDASPIPPLEPNELGIAVAQSMADIPSWCTRVIEVDETHDRRVSTSWANQISSALALAASTADRLPALVPLAGTHGTFSAREVAARWQQHDQGLATILGMGADGSVTLDLASSGPHALVAGTTGSGKSELLTTWVLGLAMAYPPVSLHILLVDYKGGATFGALAELPHTLGVLTDLDPAGTVRALASLRAELARRERTLAAAGARSLTELLDGGNALPRLLVIVDEFRTLADSHPDMLDALVRLAAQGRSLGIHLILATQRPAGAVTADMRANLPIRLCLRVLEPADSLDVLGDSTATDLPAIPGRAILRTDRNDTFQVAWPGSIDDDVPHLVRMVANAALIAARSDPDIATVHSPWAPELAESVPIPDLPEVSDGLPLLLTDLPEQQRLGSWSVPTAHTLLISGPSGSGRTTAARTIATEAVRMGLHTDVISGEPLAPPDALSLGTVCRPHEVRRVLQLLRHCSDAAVALGERVVVIDDATVVCQHIDEECGVGVGHDLLSTLLRAARSRGITMVITAVAPAQRWAALVASHLVLNPRDLGEAMAAGVPREFLMPTAPPGRGVLISQGHSTRVQVALADAAGPWGDPDRPPLTLLPLPTTVDLAPHACSDQHVLIGLDANYQPVLAPLRDQHTWLILGPPASGRSSTLAMVAARVAASGRPVWTNVDDVPAHAATGVLVVDDADRLSASAAGRIASLCQQPHVSIVAGARPESLGAAFHDLARHLRDPHVTIVLGSPSGTTPWTGIDLRGRFPTPSRLGQGVIVMAGSATAVTLDRGRLMNRSGHGAQRGPAAALQHRAAG